MSGEWVEPLKGVVFVLCVALAFFAPGRVLFRGSFTAGWVAALLFSATARWLSS